MSVGHAFEVLLRQVIRELESSGIPIRHAKTAHMVRDFLRRHSISEWHGVLADRYVARYLGQLAQRQTAALGVRRGPPPGRKSR